MNTLSLVTGANGHLGNTLIRALLAREQQVRAGVRDPQRSAALNGLDCQVVRAELQDPDSLRQAMQGVGEEPAGRDRRRQRTRHAQCTAGRGRCWGPARGLCELRGSGGTQRPAPG
jgi:NAD(P)-dependent dehydrogenase (short-subunit alcohol dehydrogenase family)